jgi:cellular nucleic acid-binding protein
MARGAPAMTTSMASNPYPKPKEHIPRITQCELCNRELPTKDWPAHKNSKKHREAEAKERAEIEAVKNPTNFGGDTSGSNNDNEFANANEFGSGDAFANATTSGDDGWGAVESFSTTKPTSYNNGGGGSGDQRACFGCGETGHQKRDCPQGSGGQTCYNCGGSGCVLQDVCCFRKTMLIYKQPPQSRLSSTPQAYGRRWRW